jgi:hypothetical protein
MQMEDVTEERFEEFWRTAFFVENFEPNSDD